MKGGWVAGPVSLLRSGSGSGLTLCSRPDAGWVGGPVGQATETETVPLFRQCICQAEHSPCVELGICTKSVGMRPMTSIVTARRLYAGRPALRKSPSGSIPGTLSPAARVGIASPRFPPTCVVRVTRSLPSVPLQPAAAVILRRHRDDPVWVHADGVARRALAGLGMTDTRTLVPACEGTESPREDRPAFPPVIADPAGDCGRRGVIRYLPLRT